MRSRIHGSGCDDSCCLRVNNLSVRIGSDAILRDVNLHVHCGEMVALIGPNGAGKSTFLKAILGQLDYDGIIAFPPFSRKSAAVFPPPTSSPGKPAAAATPWTWPWRETVILTPCTITSTP